MRVSKTKNVAMAIKVSTATSNPKNNPLLALSQSIPVAPGYRKETNYAFFTHKTRRIKGVRGVNVASYTTLVQHVT